MTGKVIYSVGGNYKVLTKDKVYNAKPLGIFRKNNEKIIVGDEVEVQINEGKSGLEEINVITKLLPRKNLFKRPVVANIDQSIIVTSINEPNLNDFYLDKLITIFQLNNVEPIIIFSKSDLGVSKEQQEIIDEYKKAGYKTLVTNIKKFELEKEILKKWTNNKLSVITGQTGVGKSTLINLIDPNRFDLKTGEISKALGRGRHTTRHTEVYEIFPKSFVIDTPGFSSIELEDFNKEEVSKNFFNFSNFYLKCKYRNCLHTNPKGCSVIENTNSKRVLDNYSKLLKEINDDNNWKNKK